MKKIQLAAFIAAAGLMLGSAYAAGLDAPVPPSFPVFSNDLVVNLI